MKTTKETRRKGIKADFGDATPTPPQAGSVRPRIGVSRTPDRHDQKHPLATSLSRSPPDPVPLGTIRATLP